jgi:cysteine-rich repeat protein
MRARNMMVIAVMLLVGTTARASECTGDCDASDSVDVADVTVGINIALGALPHEVCPVFDRDASGDVTVDELLAGVALAFDGCPFVQGIDGYCGRDGIAVNEQCDDGNGLSGDGCSADCHLEGPGALDQIWIGCDGSTFAANIGSLAPLGQEFTPRQDLLSGVAVRVTPAGGGVGTGALTARVHADSLDGAVIAEADVVADTRFETTPIFTFDPPVAVQPGARYVLELINPAGNLMWVARGRSGACAYLAGRSITAGELADGDYLFATFGR